MALPPLLRQRSLAAQIVLAVVAPVAFGALCGYELGNSEPVFNLLMLLAGVGGVLSGFEHLGPRGDRTLPDRTLPGFMIGTSYVRESDMLAGHRTLALATAGNHVAGRRPMVCWYARACSRARCFHASST